jgi:hypothetical protein
MTNEEKPNDSGATSPSETETTSIRSGIADDVLTWSGAEHGDQYEEGYHDVDYGTYLESDVEMLREELQIGLTEACLARLRDCGRGPLIIRAPVGSMSNLRHWLYFALGFTPEDPRTVTRYEPLPPQAPGEQRPRWISVGEGGQAERLEDMLELAGAEVIHIDGELRTAQLVSHEKLDGVLLRYNHCIESEFIIADICMRRGIPFMIITNMQERPPAMSLGGVVVHNPRSMKEVIMALASLPAAKLKGLTLPPPDPDYPQAKDKSEEPTA